MSPVVYSNILGGKSHACFAVLHFQSINSAWHNQYLVLNEFVKISQWMFKCIVENCGLTFPEGWGRVFTLFQ